MPEDRQIKCIHVFDLSDPEGFHSLTVSEFLDWIDDKLDVVPDEFMDTVRIKIEQEYGECDSYSKITASYERPETDEEINKRNEEERRRLINLDFQERQTYDRLRAKFDGR